MDMITYPCPNLSYPMQIKGTPIVWLTQERSMHPGVKSISIQPEHTLIPIGSQHHLALGSISSEVLLT